MVFKIASLQKYAIWYCPAIPTIIRSMLILCYLENVAAHSSVSPLVASQGTHGKKYLGAFQLSRKLLPVVFITHELVYHLYVYNKK